MKTTIECKKDGGAEKGKRKQKKNTAFTIVLLANKRDEDVDPQHDFIKCIRESNHSDEQRGELTQ